MTSTDNQDAGEQLVCVHVNCRTFSGRRKIKPEDLRLSPDQTPPQDVMSLGSKLTCPREVQRPLEKGRKAAERACAKVGSRFLGGFAIPASKADDLFVELGHIKAEFDAAVAELDRDYDRIVSQWLADAGDWAEVIKEAVRQKDEALRMVGFDYSAFKISLEEEIRTPTGVLRLPTRALKDNIFADASRTAEKLHAEIKDKVVVKATFGKSVRDLAGKVEGLAFIDPGIDAVSDLLRQAVDALEGVKAIEGMTLMSLKGLLSVVASPEQLATYSEARLEGEGHEDAMSPFFTLPDPSDEDEVEQSAMDLDDSAPSAPDSVSAEASTPEQSESTAESATGTEVETSPDEDAVSKSDSKTVVPMPVRQPPVEDWEQDTLTMDDMCAFM